jgi:hypothetical protein
MTQHNLAVACRESADLDAALRAAEAAIESYRAVGDEDQAKDAIELRRQIEAARGERRKGCRNH